MYAEQISGNRTNILEHSIEEN